MNITTRCAGVWDGSKYIVVSEESFDYEGFVALCKGASGAETAAAANNQNFASAIQSDFGTAFGNQQGILSNLTAGLGKTFANGPSQFGFSQGQVNALNSQATNGTGAQYQAAKQAAGDATAAAGGGNSFIPTGAQGQQQTALANAAAQQESNQLLGIQTAGWQQGNQNYNNALSGLLNVSSQTNPLGYANAGTSSGSSAFNDADTVSKENNAASPWNVVGGVLGGVGSTLVNGLTGNAGGATSGLSGLFGGNASIANTNTNVTSNATIPTIPLQDYNFNPAGVNIP